MYYELNTYFIHDTVTFELTLTESKNSTKGNHIRLSHFLKEVFTYTHRPLFFVLVYRKNICFTEKKNIFLCEPIRIIKMLTHYKILYDRLNLAVNIM